MMRRGLKSAAAIESDPAGLRLAVVRNEAPLALVVSGTVLILVSGAESLTAGPRNSESLISALVVALVTAGVASSIRWVPTLSSYAAALFAGNMTLIALWLLHLFVAATTIAHTGYLAVIILVLGSVSLAWGPFLASSAVVLTTALWMAQANDWGSDTAWPDTMLVSFVAGAMLLVARRRSLDELAKARSLAEQRATIDVLTGAFN